MNIRLEEINLQRPHVLPAEQEALLAEAAEVRSSSKYVWNVE